jgi:SNF2 family DNA or RNA helicase
LRDYQKRGLAWLAEMCDLGLLGTLTAFRERYARVVESGEDPEAAHRLSRLVRPFLLRRKKSDPGIAPELPPKTETERIVSLSTEQTSLYEAVVRETMDRIRESAGIARRGLVLKLLTALKQICNHPAQYLRQSGPLTGRSGKLDVLDELLGTITAEGESVLVFTQYTQMAKLIERHLTERATTSLFLHGGTPVARREEMVAAFQDGEVPVFLLSLKAAGTGLDLTRATYAALTDARSRPSRSPETAPPAPDSPGNLRARGTAQRLACPLNHSKAATGRRLMRRYGGPLWLLHFSAPKTRQRRCR